VEVSQVKAPGPGFPPDYCVQQPHRQKQPARDPRADTSRWGRTTTHPSAEDAMTDPQHRRPDDPPEWAVEQAVEDLPPDSEPSEVTALAREIAEAAQERYDERHDEYDDPDQGGEA
jgi:hypothetical protein